MNCGRQLAVHAGLLLALAFPHASPAGHAAGAEGKRPLAVEDSVGTRRILPEYGQASPVRLSPDGSHAAYVLKAPNVATNSNGYRLYVRDLSMIERRDNGRLLLQADRISRVEWIGSKQLVARVGKKSAGRIESEVDIFDHDSGTVTNLEFPVPIEDFSISRDGKIVVFSTLAKPETGASTAQSDQEVHEQRGYPIPFGGMSGKESERPRREREYEIYLGKVSGNGRIEASRLSFSDQEESRRSSLSGVQDLKLAPDGRHLLLKYRRDSLPQKWREHALIKELSGLGMGAEAYVLGLYDIATGELRVAFNYPDVLLKASWSDDGKAYSVISPSPFGSSEEIEETAAASSFGRLLYYLLRFNHVFSVDVKSGGVTRVAYRDSGQPGDPKFHSDGPLAWKTRDAMIVRTRDATFAKMHLSAGMWKESGRFSLPPDRFFRSLFDTDGRVLVGVQQATTTPPDLFLQDLESSQSTLLTDLNPEYREISLGEVEKIEWTNRYGSKCLGKLIKPVGYKSGKRYPLVLMANYTDADNFISDSLYTTAFAPQSLANAGFVVFMSQYPREDKVPRGSFAGDMGQAYNWMSMMESAIDLLAESGLVDRNRVGIVGFSRTSWLTDFLLTHSSYHFAAASSADSGIYTYGGYFKYNRAVQMNGDETQVGGPPYGETRKNWLQYAPAFNAERVRTPLLMEYVGTAEHGYEFFVALSRLGNPVELYRYPKGDHPLDTPFERVASLQRNVDWFRFWMQNYEGKAPDYDKDQYVRWRKFREDWLH